MQSVDDGVTTARIVLVGEAYGRYEVELGRPFVGPSYNDKLLPWWNACEPKLTREQFFITNVWDCGMPEAGIDRIPEFEMRAAMERCRQRVDAIKGPDGRGPVLIVVSGNYALYTFTGNGKVSFHYKDGRHDRPGISDWRGSIFTYRTNDGREIKVIATLHPQAVMGWFSRTVRDSYIGPGGEWACRKDWQRIAEDSQFYETRLPSYTKMIAPSMGEVRHWLEWTRAEAKKVAHLPRFQGRLACSLDVETPKKVNYSIVQKESTSVAPTVKCRGCGHTRRWHQDTEVIVCAPLAAGDQPTTFCNGLRGKGGCTCAGFVAPMLKPRKKKDSEEAYLGCIGYCWDPKLAVCFPTTLDFWQDPELLKQLYVMLRDFHADPNIDFGGQNFGFDAWWCAKETMPLHHIAWDLMKMHRTQRPWSKWHDLGFQASLDTRVPFWKHEAKLPDEISRWSHNREQLWSYNCTDNYAQLILLAERVRELEKRGRLGYYMQMEAPIDDELLPMSLHGIRADVPGRQAELANLLVEAKAIGAELNDVAGMKIIPNIAVSTQKMKTFLYEVHRLPVQYAKDQEGKKKASTNVIAIKRLMEAFPGLEVLQKVGRLVLKHRRTMKKATDLKDSRIEADGRAYAIFKQDTLLGRLSSSSTPKKEGANLQNVDHELRKFFVADIGDEVPH